MKVEQTAIPGVLLLTPKRFVDERGYFSESWNRETLKAHGIDIDFVQDNHSFSVVAGTLRGLHFQAPPYAQDKLVRCSRGRLFDVVVDIRKGSPTYLRWEGFELSEKGGKQLLVPKGCLHGFVTREPDTEISYKCSNYYMPDYDGAVLWNSCGIEWALDCEATLSIKDRSAPTLSAFDSPFSWKESS